MNDALIIKIIATIREHQQILKNLRSRGIDLEQFSEPVTGLLSDLVVTELGSRAGLTNDTKEYDNLSDELCEVIYGDYEGDPNIDEINIIVQLHKKISNTNKN